MCQGPVSSSSQSERSSGNSDALPPAALLEADDSETGLGETFCDHGARRAGADNEDVGSVPGDGHKQVYGPPFAILIPGCGCTLFAMPRLRPAIPMSYARSLPTAGNRRDGSPRSSVTTASLPMS